MILAVFAITLHNPSSSISIHHFSQPLPFLTFTHYKPSPLLPSLCTAHPLPYHHSLQPPPPSLLSSLQPLPFLTSLFTAPPFSYRHSSLPLPFLTIRFTAPPFLYHHSLLPLPHPYYPLYSPSQPLAFFTITLYSHSPFLTILFTTPLFPYHHSLQPLLFLTILFTAPPFPYHHSLQPLSFLTIVFTAPPLPYYPLYSPSPSLLSSLQLLPFLTILFTAPLPLLFLTITFYNAPLSFPSLSKVIAFFAPTRQCPPPAPPHSIISGRRHEEDMGKGKGTRGTGRGEEDKKITKLKTNVISAAAKLAKGITHSCFPCSQNLRSLLLLHHWHIADMDSQPDGPLSLNVCFKIFYFF